MTQLARTAYKDIDPNIVKTINHIIDSDEGGYVLSSDKDGGDGGWTYAGVTCKTWDSYYNHFSRTTKEEFQILDKNAVNQDIVEIYYNQYLAPMSEAVDIDINEIYDYELSCCINCGLAGFVAIYKSGHAPQAHVINSDKEAFCREWLHHYATICVANPAKLQYLNGWINRVFKYLS